MSRIALISFTERGVSTALRIARMLRERGDEAELSAPARLAGKDGIRPMGSL